MGDARGPGEPAGEWYEAMRSALRLALASYEMDEPHHDRELFGGPEPDPCYPEIAAEEFAGWLAGEHCGDCTGMPATCVRCYAEAIAYKADWLAARVVRVRGEVVEEFGGGEGGS